jgi:hypothetical protein
LHLFLKGFLAQLAEDLGGGGAGPPPAGVRAAMQALVAAARALGTATALQAAGFGSAAATGSLDAEGQPRVRPAQAKVELAALTQVGAGLGCRAAGLGCPARAAEEACGFTDGRVGRHCAPAAAADGRAAARIPAPHPTPHTPLAQAVDDMQRELAAWRAGAREHWAQPLLRALHGFAAACRAGQGAQHLAGPDSLALALLVARATAQPDGSCQLQLRLDLPVPPAVTPLPGAQALIACHEVVPHAAGEPPPAAPAPAPAPRSRRCAC